MIVGMDKKSKILLLVFFILIILAVTLTFYRVMVAKDYLISTEVACDPAIEKCFQRLCDPETEECANADNPEMIYYKILEKNYKNIKPCDPADENCQNLTCEPGEKDCQEILCDENALEEWEECADLEAGQSEPESDQAESDQGELEQTEPSQTEPAAEPLAE